MQTNKAVSILQSTKVLNSCKFQIRNREDKWQMLTQWLFSFCLLSTHKFWLKQSSSLTKTSHRSVKIRIPRLEWKREGIKQKKRNLVFTSQNRIWGNRERKILRPEKEKCSRREVWEKNRVNIFIFLIQKKWIQTLKICYNF